MDTDFDVIVVGGGHAGCEAAAASSNLGAKTLLISMDMFSFARMSCNPAVGGIAKGQIVREIDALGGYTGIVTDASSLQFRMLNRSKGPAMWSPRAQCDKSEFSSNWRRILETRSNLMIYADIVTSLTFQGSRICGVVCRTGVKFTSKTLVLTTGTFLGGKIFIGRNSFPGGRIGEQPSLGLTEQLKEMGIRTSRMKTGTPPRIDLSSVDLTQSVLQEGDVNPEKFSFLPYLSTAQSYDQMPCYIFHTNEKVHDILRSGFKDSPLFNGLIHGKGPRYCPSIEDKLRTFPDKDSHQLFLEPEGRHTKEYYLQGFSSSLPLQVQLDALHAINGFQNAKIYKPAYAVEYDYFDPGQLSQSLESQVVDCLFLAGQVNGTTGYEEAAGQGIIAGINAALKSLGKEPFVLGRDEAYIGVLIDDLITKGVDEPYRMFTSRAEYRILLRQDNADFRLTSKSHDIGLASEYRYDFTSRKYDKISLLSDFALSVNIKPDAVNAYLESIDSAPISESKKISDILSRPGTKYSDLIKIVPRGTIQSHSVDSSSLKLGHISSLDFNSIDFLKTDVGLSDDSPEFNKLNPLYLDELYTSVEIQLKYQGYIGREERNAGKISRLENLIIPDDFDFSRLSGLSIECRQKLAKYKPHTISQASRISGVSPSDISVLLVYFGR